MSLNKKILDGVREVAFVEVYKSVEPMLCSMMIPNYTAHIKACIKEEISNSEWYVPPVVGSSRR